MMRKLDQPNYGVVMGKEAEATTKQDKQPTPWHSCSKLAEDKPQYVNSQASLKRRTQVVHGSILLPL